MPWRHHFFFSIPSKEAAKQLQVWERISHISYAAQSNKKGMYFLHVKLKDLYDTDGL